MQTSAPETMAETRRAARFWGRVAITPGCWLYQGPLDTDGYASFIVRGRRVYAHRYAYQLTHGYVPPGAHVDHVRSRGCEFRNCVNPAHLEAVTPTVNALRGDSPAARNARKTHCDRNHPLSGDNLITLPNGTRRCRTCTEASGQRYRERHADTIRARARARYHELKEAPMIDRAPDAELSIRAAAEYAGVSERTVRNWVGDHWVRARATAEGRLIPQADLDRVVAARRAGQVPGPLPPPALVPVGAAAGPGLGTPDATTGPATASAGDGAGGYALAVLEVTAGGLVGALARRDAEVAWLRDELARANERARDQAETIGTLRAELRGRVDQVLVLAALLAAPDPAPAPARAIEAGAGSVAGPLAGRCPWRWWAAHRPSPSRDAAS